MAIPSWYMGILINCCRCSRKYAKKKYDITTQQERQLFLHALRTWLCWQCPLTTMASQMLSFALFAQTAKKYIKKLLQVRKRREATSHTLL